MKVTWFWKFNERLFEYVLFWLWDAEFVNVDHVTLFELFRAAAYLGVDSLLELTCWTVTSRDFSPKEEEEFSKENQWHFE